MTGNYSDSVINELVSACAEEYISLQISGTAWDAVIYDITVATLFKRGIYKLEVVI